jgi:hypothetical protein
MSKSRLSEGLKRAQMRLTKSGSTKILNNVFLLYLVLFISISDLLYMASNGAYVNVGVFVLAGYITSMFSKNMMVIMLAALAITNIYALGKSIVVKEGLTVDNDDKEEIDIDAKLKEEGEKDKKEEAESKKKHKKQHKDMDKDELSEEFEKEAMTSDEKLPTGFKEALSKLENPETLKTIEGLKELAPMIEQMSKMIEMMK